MKGLKMSSSCHLDLSIIIFSSSSRHLHLSILIFSSSSFHPKKPWKSQVETHTHEAALSAKRSTILFVVIRVTSSFHPFHPHLLLICFPFTNHLLFFPCPRTHFLETIRERGEEIREKKREERKEKNMNEMFSPCCICLDESESLENPLIHCHGDGCNFSAHQACYGISLPQGPWFCRRCQSQERTVMLVSVSTFLSSPWLEKIFFLLDWRKYFFHLIAKRNIFFYFSVLFENIFSTPWFRMKIFFSTFWFWTEIFSSPLYPSIHVIYWWERERKGEKKREGKREKERESFLPHFHLFQAIWISLGHKFNNKGTRTSGSRSSYSFSLFSLFLFLLVKR